MIASTDKWFKFCLIREIKLFCESPYMLWFRKKLHINVNYNGEDIAINS